jgi:hypothetical protein
MSIEYCRDLKQGDLVRCTICEYEVVEARVQIEDGEYFLCQNCEDGQRCHDTMGYDYSWGIDTKSSTLSDNEVYDVEIISKESNSCFIVDEWYKHKDGGLMCYQGGKSAYGMSKSGEWRTLADGKKYSFVKKPEEWSKVETREVKDMLIEYANSLFKIGYKVNPVKTNGDIAKTTRFMGRAVYSYYKITGKNCLVSDGIRVMCHGNWAEVISRETTGAKEESVRKESIHYDEPAELTSLDDDDDDTMSAPIYVAKISASLR